MVYWPNGPSLPSSHFVHTFCMMLAMLLLSPLLFWVFFSVCVVVVVVAKADLKPYIIYTNVYIGVGSTMTAKCLQVCKS